MSKVNEREALEKLGFEYDSGDSVLNVNTDIMEKFNKHVSVEWPPEKEKVYEIFWEDDLKSGPKTIKGFDSLILWITKFLK